MSKKTDTYSGYWYPTEIISHAVWLYFHFTLSFRDVDEIRIWDDSGTYRVIYTARMADAVYVLHAFQKKTQATSKRDLDTAKERFAHLMRMKQ